MQAAKTNKGLKWKRWRWKKGKSYLLLTSSSSFNEARGTTDANPAFRLVAMAMVIVLTTNSLTSGIDFLRDASRMSGVASIPEKNGLSLFFVFRWWATIEKKDWGRKSGFWLMERVSKVR